MFQGCGLSPVSARLSCQKGAGDGGGGGGQRQTLGRRQCPARAHLALQHAPSEAQDSESLLLDGMHASTSRYGTSEPHDVRFEVTVLSWPCRDGLGLPCSAIYLGGLLILRFLVHVAVHD